MFIDHQFKIKRKPGYLSPPSIYFPNALDFIFFYKSQVKKLYIVYIHIVYTRLYIGFVQAVSRTDSI